MVVTHNSEMVVLELLDSLDESLLSGELSEIVVVDNGSTDGTVRLLSDRVGITFVPSTNRGYAAGVNLGASTAADWDFLLVLNPDVRLMSGCLSALLADAEGSPRPGIYGPRVVDANGRLVWSIRRSPTVMRALGLGGTGRPSLSEHVSNAAEYRRRHAVEWLLGAILLISRKCYDDVGGWDESYFLYSEETDFCLRARDLGWPTWYEPAAVATHIGGASGRSQRTHVMQIVNRVRLYRRRHGALSSMIYYGLTLLAEVMWIARGHRASIASASALLRPNSRPIELGASSRLIPQ